MHVKASGVACHGMCHGMRLLHAMAYVMEWHPLACAMACHALWHGTPCHMPLQAMASAMVLPLTCHCTPCIYYGMTGHVPWHAMASFHGICHFMPWHMPSHAIACCNSLQWHTQCNAKAHATPCHGICYGSCHGHGICHSIPWHMP